MSDTQGPKPDCKYGSKCYRKNPEHLADYNHPHDPLSHVVSGLQRTKLYDGSSDDDSDSTDSRPLCQYGQNCYRTNPDHLMRFRHTGDDRPQCEFGQNCYRQNPDHFAQYSHSGGIGGRTNDKKDDKIKILEQRVKTGETSSRKELNPNDDALEFNRIKDMVEKYVTGTHKFSPNVTRIEKVENPKVELDFEKFRPNLNKDFDIEKFHGTSNDAIQPIIDNGFRLGSKTNSMYGAGIYFATDSSKSAQDIYTKGSKKLLLCTILAGEPKTVTTPDYNMTFETIRREGFDSAFAPRNTKDQGGVMYDEFIIYNPHQAKVDYVVHF